MEDLEKLLSIDETNLAMEWVKQPVRLLEAYKALATYELDSNLVEIELDDAEGELFLKLKAEGIPGLDRTTDEAIKRYIDQDTNIDNIRQKVAMTKTRVTIARGLVKAFEQRAMALKYMQGILFPSFLSQNGIEAEA